MSMMISKWRPSWWSDAVHGSAWDHAKEAMRRDWSQTKHDLHVGGHEMNQSASDTLKQAAGREHLPTINQANPPEVIGVWTDAEVPYRYGYAARRQFGAEHSEWSPELEAKLKHEWMTAQDWIAHDWESARRFVRRGYELEDQDKDAKRLDAEGEAAKGRGDG
jgi:hypothetical protein